MPRMDSIPRRKWIVASLALLLLLLIGYAAQVYVSLSGGIMGVISDLKPTPDPESPALKASRDAALHSIQSSIGDLESTEVSLRRHSSSSSDDCKKGQNNWEVHEGFAYRCTQWVTVVYGFNADFRSWLANFDEKLGRKGWQQSPDQVFNTKEVLQAYYDPFHGQGKAPPKNFPNGYLVSDLPTFAEYARDDTALRMQFVERATVASNDPLETGFLHVYPALREVLATNDYALIATFRKVYFEN